MSVTEMYRQQYPWRPWDRIYPLLGNLSGQLVLDLGCGIGDQAADLARLGAEVIGVDMNESLVEVARAREIPRARFVRASASSTTSDHRMVVVVPSLLMSSWYDCPPKRQG